MTGRLHLVAEDIDFMEVFANSDTLTGLHPMPARHNVAPTDPVLTILHEYGQRCARLMKWSFVPDWVKDPREFSLLTIARVEGVERKPSFRNAIRYRRCLVPVTGFYEWQRNKVTGEAIPHFFRKEDAGLFALAGIWESWMGPNGEEFDGLAILTRSATAPFRAISDRLPLIVAPEHHEIWLDTRSGRFEDARPLLKSPSPDDLVAFAVSDRVNHRGNDDPSLTLPRHGRDTERVRVSFAKPDKQQKGKEQDSSRPAKPKKEDAEDNGQLDLF
nr:SOS response-associated peptidase [uncultured Cohaesibacter sp.]